MTPTGSRRLGPRAVLAAAFAALMIALCAAPTGPVRAAAQDVGTDAQRESGKKLYDKYCSQCHGEKGDGEGYATPHLYPKPRNFTTGKYKVRTTPTGALPTHQDLISIIRRGMPYTSMPGWPNFTDPEVSDLAHFLTTFSSDFANKENVPQPVPLPAAPAATKESVEAGKKLYEETGCIACHGTLGRGDGTSAPGMVDDFGQPIRPANLSQSWTFRGGASREDIYRTMSTGFNGTPMPGFDDTALEPEHKWAITDYILSLSGGSAEPGYNNLVVAKHVLDPIDLSKGTASFESARVARFPIVGQIMEPGRSFNPPATSVTVQAIYDAESIAVLVRWHDMSAERAGKNGPSLPVPPEEEARASTAATAAGDGAVAKDPFAEEITPARAGQATTKEAAQPADPFAEPAATAAPVSEFSDAVAVQIPSQVPTGARKPYFIFGDGQNSVDLWFFDLARPEPLQFTAKGSTEIVPDDAGELSGVASYDQGEWSVIFKRPLRPSSGARLLTGEFMPIAFSVWDGLSGERGNRRGLTLWYSLYIEPELVQSAVGPMVKTGLFILALELIVIALVRSRYRSGGRVTQPTTTSA